MKNILIVFTVLAMASAANAALLISVGGVVDPEDTTITIKPSEHVVIDIWGDGQTDPYGFYFGVIYQGGGYHAHGIGKIKEPGLGADFLDGFAQAHQVGDGAQFAENIGRAHRVPDGLLHAVFAAESDIFFTQLLAAYGNAEKNEIRAL